MNWWDILKVDPYLEAANLNYQKDLFGQGAKGTQTTFKQPFPIDQQQFTQQNPSVNSSENQQTLQHFQDQQTLDQQTIPNLPAPNNQQQLLPTQTNLAPRQLTLGNQRVLTTNNQNNTTQNIPQDASSGESGGEDDSDVGEVRENVSRAKQNLTQLPRGPKARILTQVLTDLSAAAIDPVNQRQIAIDAKNKLQDAFPAQS